MDVTLLYFEGCPHWKIASERLNVLTLERTDVTVKHQLVETPEQADHFGFLGSPSIQVGGVDVFAEPGSQVGLTCRRYLTPDGYAGAPTLEQLREVFSDA
ncbi:thioredoxin family protein [Salinibacterium sp. G-O1]|uniref:thioredoxin family protein n=1 Tax=Salinibacterium sp. G-O1 TaxID=3046208 RepID=UPI0024B93F27|nr:thioredoxin family protein [Salinibacterium sp. G-O1]MDJ0334873.1 thioredoxin family protein [Salinibacterium sp. G-O1]